MMIILNLGCGTKVSASPEVMNLDWSVYLRIRRNRLLRSMAPYLIQGPRLEGFLALPDNIMVHNLAKGIPFSDESVDVVYHSHFLEHLDRETARRFLMEVKRVLKRNGIQRIVVPDLERLCRRYLTHLSSSEGDPDESNKHDEYVAAIIEQSVRREAHGSSQQRPLRRRIENLLLGDARARGETHQWLYDRINLSALLLNLGYRNPTVQSYNQSLIPSWEQYALDLGEDGLERKVGSLYMESIK